ncbi:autotransporter outer membrane beta-barrel domain-containing protein [Aquabacter sp. CN5-332]|uniref:autotransporter outer membrane beta-barrel domain-containing protein n=1 Tax=Aquabacter sp. CN5-332 TaxID=3156608 RepID=UPI0032B62325
MPRGLGARGGSKTGPVITGGSAALGLAMLAMLPAGSVAAQTTVACTGTNPCVADVPAGNPVSVPIFLNSNSPTDATQFNNTQVITFPLSSSYGYGLNANVTGTSGMGSSSGPAGAGGITGTVTATNSNSISLGGNGTAGINANAFWIQSVGGYGGSYSNSNGKYDAGAGGNSGDVVVNNTSSIAMPAATLPGGGMALIAQAVGGQGGGVLSNGTDDFGLPTFGGSGNGGNGGAAGNVTVNNSGTVSVGLNGPTFTIGGYTSGQESYSTGSDVFGFRAISATANGGFAGQGAGASGSKCDTNGTGCGGGAVGGSAGTVVVNNSGQVGVNWNWNLGSGSAPLPREVAFGIVAASVGADGQPTYTQDYSGGGGGSAAGALVTLTQGGNVFITSQNDVPPGYTPPTPISAFPILTGAAVAALTQGGTGGSPYEASHEIGANPVIAGGAGGTAGGAAVQVQDAQVSVIGNGFAGILARSTGGAGGDGNNHLVNGVGEGGNDSNGGKGGAASGAGASLAGTAALSTTGALSPGMVVLAIGGRGGDGSTYDTNDNPAGDAGYGGAGGTAGDATATMSGSSSIQTNGSYAAGIVVGTQGGNGGNGGNRDTGQSGNAGAGGAAGSGGDINVSLIDTASIVTQGAYSPGIAARSEGGLGGAAGIANPNFGSTPQPGGNGGNSGFVYVVLDQAGTSITTYGAASPGIIASSVSGYGGVGSITSDIFANVGGNGGAGGQAGHTYVENNTTAIQAAEVENWGRITTLGAASHGIVAQALSGGGGAGGASGGIFGQGGSGATAGAVGSVTVTSQAGSAIITSGQGAFGILAQAIGGSGGDGGTLDFANSGIGGSSGLASNGGPVTVTHAGTITTSGSQGVGIVAQSIGGGGGTGGDATGPFAVGGSGGAGGYGATSSVTMSGGSIDTTGSQAFGVLTQSIGGGGGTGGNAGYSYDPNFGPFISVSVGGTGGTGGGGGAASFAGTGGGITTQGSGAIGVVAQSIGGGGGNAGGAYAQSIGVGISIGVAVGGSGGTAGAGGDVTVNTSNFQVRTGQSPSLTVPQSTPTNVLPTDAYGIVAQSIGGGGGNGGTASAQAVAIALHIPATTKEVAGSVASSVGGAGGSAGDGGAVTLTLGGGTVVETAGQGSHAVIAQSVGGGGGNGGDSSAMAATVAYGRAGTLGQNPDTDKSVQTWTGDIAVSVGGQTGGSGNGGTVAVTLGDTAAASILTVGDYSNGILVQSIGGGGGNGGTGSSTTADYGSTRNGHLAIGVGGASTGGGNGGEADVTLNSGSSIQTFGSGSAGIVAQSIGGGGGTSGGGMLDLGFTFQVAKVQDGKPYLENVTPSGTVEGTVGGSGSGGGAGGIVNVTVNGQIATHGGDAPGVLAQSIGGGGGLGGSAGSDASADSPLILQDGVWLREFITNTGISKTEPYSATLSMAVGGTGGEGGPGGTINVTHAGLITTAGDWSHGILAQSVGGGGGKGGTATATGSGAAPVISLNLGGGIGGAGGGGGAGGQVNLALENGSVTTSGYSAYGIVGQSVGGGGGVAANGSDTASGVITIGASGGGSGGGAGSGGSVSLTGSSTAFDKSLNAVTTSGLGAHGIVLQSIGGGGGIAGAGGSVSLTTPQTSGSISLAVGGGTGSNGNGGEVSVNSQLRVTTSGNNAIGLLAQSIGGGGGLGFTVPGTATVMPVLGGTPNGILQNGGAVTVTLLDTKASSNITTSGVGAHGIVAQSIGGGGGVAGYVNGTPTLSTTLPANAAAQGNGGAVTLNLVGGINTTGASAHGVIAQSVAAGGGLIGYGSTLYAGSTGSGGSGTAGQVTVNLDSTFIQTTGANSVGIFAQSAPVQGAAANTGAQTVVVNLIGSRIQGGSGEGAAIWVDGGIHPSSTDPTQNNLITVDVTSSISALSGQLIAYTGSSGVDVQNDGVASGSVSLGTGTFTNGPTGSLHTGSTVAAAQLVNRGQIFIGTPGSFDRTTLTGDFVQTRTGVLVIDADFSARTVDRLSVGGNAVLDGRVQVVSSNLLPNSPLTFLDVSGTAAGTLDGAQANMFDFDVSQSGTSYAVSATADFNQPAFGLNPGQARAAGHLQAAWNAGGGGLGPVFGALANINLAAYPAVLSNLASETVNATGAESISLAQQHLDRLMSCPVFEGQTAIVTQTSCVWAVASGQVFDQSAFGGAAGYSDTVYSYAVGMQKEIAPHWFFGIAAGYDDSLISGGATSANGSTGWIGASLKYETGPWQFAAAASGSFGSYDVTRWAALGSLGGLAEGTNNLGAGAARLRAAYTIGGDRFYARPFVDLDLLYTSLSGYAETGAGLLDRQVSGSAQWTALATPAVEFGTRLDLNGGMVLRGYAKAGVTLSSTDSWSNTVSLLAAPAAAGGFSVVLPMDDIYARVGAGIDLTGLQHGFGLRAEYEGAFSEHTSRNMGSLRLSVQF